LCLPERSAAILFGRRFLAHPEAHRPFVGGDLFARIGGPAAVGVLVDGLYDRIENDAALQPLFSRDLTGEREAHKRFFSERLGGVSSYSSTTHLPLKHRHDLLPITRVLAGKWLAHFHDALNIAVADVDARRVIYENVRALGLALVNESEPHTALRARSHGTCLRYSPPTSRLNWRAGAMLPPCASCWRMRPMSLHRHPTLPNCCCSQRSPDACQSSSFCSIRASM
jgi:truncated hemoglobin YjbI